MNAGNAVLAATPLLPVEKDVSSSPAVPGPIPVVLSFDVEEHHGIERLALWLSRRDHRCGATVLYFHPWEFDPGQPRLPLGGLNRFRTYVGIRHSRDRLLGLLAGHRYLRGVDLARELDERRERLPGFRP